MSRFSYLARVWGSVERCVPCCVLGKKAGEDCYA